MQALNHDKIELRAYELWEQEGRPFGRAEEFWFRASTELTAVNGTEVKKAKKAAAPKAKPAVTAKAKAVAAPAAKPAAKAKKKAPAKKAN